MKLIDLLIGNDIQWPKGAEGVVQDGDCFLKFYVGEKPAIHDIGVWLTSTLALDPIYIDEVASDYKTAIITKTDWDNRKMNKKAMFADIKVGDKVWDIRRGWGVVSSLAKYNDYPICVYFGRAGGSTYTWDGYFHLEHVNPSIFWDEVKIEVPPKPLPDLEVDTKVFVWDNLGTELCRHFSHFNEDGVLYAFDGGRTSFTGSGDVTDYLMFGDPTDDCSITPEEFLGLVYEPESCAKEEASQPDHQHPAAAQAAYLKRIPAEAGIQPDGQVLKIQSKFKKAPDILSAGIKHMEDRAALRDSPEGERSMKAAVAAFNALEGTNLTEVQGWRFMCVLKHARAAKGDLSIDDYEDAAAYWALAAESAQQQ